MENLDEQVTLSEDDCAKIRDWFNKHSKADTKCPVCRSKGWFNHKSVYTPVVFNLVKNRHVQNRLKPTVIVECSTCGHYSYFSAQKVGIDVSKYSIGGGA